MVPAVFVAQVVPLTVAKATPLLAALTMMPLFVRFVDVVMLPAVGSVKSSVL